MNALRIFFYQLAGPLLLFSLACCSGKHKKDKAPAPAPVILRKDIAPVAKAQSGQTAPIINITDTLAPKITVLYIKDSASTAYRLSIKLGQIYGQRLSTVMKHNKLKMIGAPIAWYQTQKAPFFFEAGLAVDKRPAKLPKNILVRSIGGDSVLVAHFYGPYNQTGVAYDALRDWLKDHKKKLKAPAYEMYIGDPIDKNGNAADPYKVQTDIIFEHD